jgi:glycosyltransferase involved in cell wall biosynthesis
MASSKLSFITATFPPTVCGVGDHTAQLATALARTHEVKVLTAYGEAKDLGCVKVEQAFRYDRPRSIFSLVEPIIADKPDWVIVQYDPFSYGARYGFNPYLPLAMNLLKRRSPQIKLGLVVHESFVPVHNWKSIALSLELKAQLWSLARVADAVFTATEPWVGRLIKWFPRKTIKHLPVGSNMPCVSLSRDEARSRLGISQQTTVLGLFGRIQKTRSLEHISQAIKRTRAAGLDVLVLYMGHDADAARRHLGNVALLADGPLAPEEISKRFTAMDVYLMPIDEGISTRRTSLMTGLQHGIATVATSGQATDRLLLREDGKAFLLADVCAPEVFGDHVLDLISNSARRKLLSDGAAQLFSREFTWERISQTLLATLAT